MATSLQKIDDPRLAYILKKIKEKGIRFPVAELTEKMETSKSKVSETLSGKRPVSDSFFEKFCEVFGLDGNYSPFLPDDPNNWTMAAIKALSWGLANALSEISELKGKPRDPADFLEEIDKSTNLILHDLRKSGKK